MTALATETMTGNPWGKGVVSQVKCDLHQELEGSGNTRPHVTEA